MPSFDRKQHRNARDVAADYVCCFARSSALYARFFAALTEARRIGLTNRAAATAALFADSIETKVYRTWKSVRPASTPGAGVGTV